MTMRDDIAAAAGKRMDQSLGPPPGPPFLEDQAERLITASLQPRLQSAGYGRRIAVALLAASVVAATVTTVLIGSRTDTIAYTIGSEQASPENKWFDNVHSTPLPIRFDNGTRMSLFKSSTARVREADNKRVIIDLRQGRLYANVKGNGKTEWVIAAGPYRIKVLGTKFLVQWNPNTEVLDLDVTSGRVSVRDSEQDGTQILVPAGKSLHRDRRTGRIVLEDRAPGASSPNFASATTFESTAPTGDETLCKLLPAAEPPSADTEIETPVPPSVTQAKESPPVRKKSVGGAHSPIPGDPSSMGAFAETASVDELWSRANRLRHRHKGEDAARLFAAVQQRFPEDPRAETALFLRGETSLSLIGDPRAARQYFSQYLRETQSNALREEALGRLMEINVTLGDHDAAKRIATQYLSRYSGGIFHHRATAILNR